MDHKEPPLPKEPPVLGTGPPTDEELDYYYTPMFSWDTVKDQVSEYLLSSQGRDLTRNSG